MNFKFDLVNETNVSSTQPTNIEGGGSWGLLSQMIGSYAPIVPNSSKNNGRKQQSGKPRDRFGPWLEGEEGSLYTSYAWVKWVGRHGSS